MDNFGSFENFVAVETYGPVWSNKSEVLYLKDVSAGWARLMQNKLLRKRRTNSTSSSSSSNYYDSLSRGKEYFDSLYRKYNTSSEEKTLTPSLFFTSNINLSVTNTSSPSADDNKASYHRKRMSDFDINALINQLPEITTSRLSSSSLQDNTNPPASNLNNSISNKESLPLKISSATKVSNETSRNSEFDFADLINIARGYYKERRVGH